MPARVLTKEEVENMGLNARKTSKGGKTKRVNPHVQEIMDQVRGTKAGQFLIYEPADGKSYQSQVLRVRKAFDELEKPWPLTRPGDKGAYTVIKILSKKESFQKYPQQPLAPQSASKNKEKSA